MLSVSIETKCLSKGFSISFLKGFIFICSCICFYCKDCNATVIPSSFFKYFSGLETYQIDILTENGYGSKKQE